MIRRPPRSTQGVSSAASDVYKRQQLVCRLAKLQLSARMVVAMVCMATIAAYAFVQNPLRQNIRPNTRPGELTQRNGEKNGRLQRGAGANAAKHDTLDIKAQPILADDDSIPDSLLHPRWQIQRTLPITLDDLHQGAADLKRPDNLKQEVEYNDSTGLYVIGSKISNTYINAPVMMTMEEYMKWSEKQLMDNFFRKKNDEIYQALSLIHI